MRWLGVAALAVMSFAATGCGLLMDSAYWMGDNSYQETSEQSKPTSETYRAVEYQGVLDSAGSLHLVCEQRTRTIDRSWQISKTWQRRGGYDKDTYAMTALLSGLFAGVTVATAGAACAKDDLDVSCWNLAFAAPWVADVAWSLYRRATVKPPKLVDKHTYDDHLVLGGAVASEPVECADAINRLALGSASGPTVEAMLNGSYTGAAAAQRLNEGAITLLFDDQGAVVLAARPEVVQAWAANESLGLWVVDQRGDAHPVQADRCSLLRPQVPSLAAATRSQFQQQCSLHPPPVTGR